MTAIDTLLIDALTSSDKRHVRRIRASRLALDAIMREDGASLWPVRVWGVPITHDPELDHDGMVVIAERDA